MNYYFDEPDIKQLHIGKFEPERRFLFQAQPEFSVYTREDWNAYLWSGCKQGGKLTDELGVSISLEQFMRIVDTQQYKDTNLGGDGFAPFYRDADGYEFCICDFT